MITARPRIDEDDIDDDAAVATKSTAAAAAAEARGRRRSKSEDDKVAAAAEPMATEPSIAAMLLDLNFEGFPLGTAEQSRLNYSSKDHNSKLIVVAAYVCRYKDSTDDDVKDGNNARKI